MLKQKIIFILGLIFYLDIQDKFKKNFLLKVSITLKIKENQSREEKKSKIEYQVHINASTQQRVDSGPLGTHQCQEM